MKNKNMRGITLISLVVTIMLLVILSIISLSLILGNDKLLNKTEIASEKYNKQAAIEAMNIKITNVQVYKYSEEQRMPTLKELADNFCEDDDFQYVQETSRLASLAKINSESPISIYTKLKAYPYEFEINSSLQLASIDGVKVEALPKDEDDVIISMTKSELDNYIQSAINSKLDSYFCTSKATTTSSASIEHPAVIVENYYNGTNWYRIWSDGWIEQGGQSTGGASSRGKKTMLLKPFSNTNYTLNTAIFRANGCDAAACVVRYNQKDTDGFYATTSWTNSNSMNFEALVFSWYACGY